MNYFEQEYRKRTPGSARLHQRARQVMPGGVSHQKRYFAPYPLYVERADGAYVWDIDGNQYVDLWMGHYSHILGHRPEAILPALLQGASEGPHWGIPHPLQIEYAEKIQELVPAAERLRIGVTGTEATMYAVRVARAYTGRSTILKVKGGWHGANTDLTAYVHAPMDKGETAGLPSGIGSQLKAFSFNDFADTRRAVEDLGENLAAVIIEPVGSCFLPPAEGYLSMIREATRKVGALLIFDEVISGFRLGLGGAQERYGMEPDLMTLGKVAGGGMPVGIVAGRREIMEIYNPETTSAKGTPLVFGGGTFSALRPAMAAGLAMLRHLEEYSPDLYAELDAKGEKVRRGIEAVMREAGIAARCTGVGSLFNTVFLKESNAERSAGEGRSSEVEIRNNEDVELRTDLTLRDRDFRLGMLNRGVYLVRGGGALSTAHSDAEIDQIINAAGETAREMAWQLA